MQENKPHYPVIILQKGKDEAIKRFHPWIFSGAIKLLPANLEAGHMVHVSDNQGNILGTGFYEKDTIAVKLVSFGLCRLDADFWKNKISEAFNLRIKLGLVGNKQTSAYRLVHSEGDNLAGLIIDIYNKTAVIQTQSSGMTLQIEAINSAILTVMKDKIEAIYWKSAKIQSGVNKDLTCDGFIYGQANDQVILENGMKYYIDIEKGQKTGFFIDQRENRNLLKSLSEGKRVLNTFSYSGGFSVAALQGKATSVVSVDSSQTAIDLCNQNITLNGIDEHQHTSVTMDAKRYLTELKPGGFDLIVLDPPAFVKNHQNRHKGLLAYKFINYEAIKNISPGGFLFTFSCSQAIDPQSFQSVVMAAAIEAGRNVRIVYHLSQPADHPVNIFHPEGNYLKGLVLEVI
ncbi:MAG: class I SAM-dependent rRNA methyltransferase [Bacteroidales bacterium]|nr:class I SAM-dependent rRNA methyltransferase [Bacteroidales bacterium]